jgi:hypothetical protein
MTEIKREASETKGRVKFVQQPKPPDPNAAKLAEINTRAKDGKLTLADLNAKMDIILEEIRKAR